MIRKPLRLPRRLLADARFRPALQPPRRQTSQGWFRFHFHWRRFFTMKRENKKQLQTLLALVGLLAAVGFYEYWTNFRTAPVTSTPVATVAKNLLQGSGNAQIRLDLIGDTPDKDSVGKKNV